MAVTNIEIMKVLRDPARGLIVRVDFTVDDVVVPETFTSVDPNPDWLENQIRERVARFDKLTSRQAEIEIGPYVLPPKAREP